MKSHITKTTARLDLSYVTARRNYYEKMLLINISFCWLKPKSIVDATLVELLKTVDGRALLLLLLELWTLWGGELLTLCGGVTV